MGWDAAEIIRLIFIENVNDRYDFMIDDYSDKSATNFNFMNTMVFTEEIIVPQEENKGLFDQIDNIEHSQESSEVILSPSPEDWDQLVYGIASGLENKDLSKDIQACLQGEQPLVQDIEDAINDLREETLEGLEDAAHALYKAYTDYQTAMQTCKGYNGDMDKLLADLNQLVENLKAVNDNKYKFAKNMARNPKQVASDLANM